MKQLIGLIRLGALTAAFVPHPETLATKPLDCRLPREGELVLLGIDGTVVAHEINLALRAGYSPCLFGAKVPHLHIVACD